jgi:hypothetical protein
MKPRAKIILGAALLIFLAAMASLKHRAGSDASRSAGACCSFLPTLDRTSSPSVTNGATINCNPNAPTTTNLMPSAKQP